MLSCFDEEEFVYGETYAAARTSTVEVSVRFAQRVEECQTRRHQVRYAKHQIKHVLFEIASLKKIKLT